MTNINHLPLELISDIVQYLPQQDLYSCTLVNKKFFQASNRWLWRAPKRVTTATLYNFMASVFKAHRPVELYIRTLSFWQFTCSNYELLRLLKHARKLKELTILGGDQKITDNTLKYIPGYCHHLTSLTLNVGSITHISMDNLGQYCHQLTQLKLVMSRTTTQVNARFFQQLVHCPLKKLYLSGLTLAGAAAAGAATKTASPNSNTNTNDDSDDNDDDTDDVETLFTTLATLNGLTHLTLQGRTRSTATMFDGTRCLQIILKLPTTTWPHLEDLHLMPCFKLDDALAIRFIKTHPHLHSLYLCGPVPLPRTLPLPPIIIPPLRLQQNVLRYLTNHTDNGRTFLPPLPLPPPPIIPTMRGNNNNNNNNNNHAHPPALKNEGISDTTLKAIATFLPTIEKIGVSNHGGLTPQGLKHLIQHCPRLKKLYFACCGIKITDFPPSCVDTAVLQDDDDGVYLEWLNDGAMQQFRKVMKDQQHGNPSTTTTSTAEVAARTACSSSSTKQQ